MTKILNATYGTVDKPLIIGEIEIPCYVLEDGKRVITQRGLYKALGLNVGGAAEKYKEFGGAARIAAFIDKNTFIQLRSKALRPLRNPVLFKLDKFISKNDKLVYHGYEALLLQEIVRAISKAYLRGELTGRNEEVGRNAEILDDAFSKIGIIALIDEVTGYQESREKTALQDFLAKFIKEERGVYIKTYPDDFFEALFKMKGLTWSLANKGQKPQYIGHYINNYVYSRIAPKVLIELKKVNPKDENGKRKAKYTQHIDVDYGHPKLKEHLNTLTAFARAAGFNWNGWQRMVERAFPKFDADGSAAPEIDFPEGG